MPAINSIMYFCKVVLKCACSLLECSCLIDISYMSSFFLIFVHFKIKLMQILNSVFLLRVLELKDLVLPFKVPAGGFGCEFLASQTYLSDIVCTVPRAHYTFKSPKKVLIF